MPKLYQKEMNAEVRSKAGC